MALGTYLEFILDQSYENIKKLELVFEAAHEGYFFMSMAGSIQFFNKTFYSHFDIDIENSHYAFDHWLRLVHNEDRQSLSDAIQNQFADKQDLVISQYRMRNKENHWIWIESLGKLVIDPLGNIEALVGSHTDITALKLREESIKNLAYKDSLTGFYNRNQIIESIETHLTEEKCSHLIYIDLENFRAVNSILGFSGGDEILRHISNLMMSALPETAILARNYGAEFMILLEASADIDIHELTQTLYTIIQSPILLMHKYLVLSAKICVFPVTDFTLSSNQVIQKSQMMLSAMKENALSPVLFFDDAIEQQYLRKIEIERSMKSALSHRQFHVFFQPIVKLQSNHIIGFEALLRWEHPDFSWISPDEFIPIAERTHQINEIGHFVLIEACRFIHAVSNPLFKPHVSVNISAIQLDQTCFVQQVLRVIDDQDISRSQIIIEVTESATLEGSEHRVERLVELHSEGIALAIDDFGTGYSSINSIITLPISYLKIDKSIIQKTLYNQKNRFLIEMLSVYSAKSKYHIVAEGVEDEQLHDALKNLEITYGQGFYYGKAISQADTLSLLKAKGLL